MSYTVLLRRAEEDAQKVFALFNVNKFDDICYEEMWAIDDRLQYWSNKLLVYDENNNPLAARDLTLSEGIRDQGWVQKATHLLNVAIFTAALWSDTDYDAAISNFFPMLIPKEIHDHDDIIDMFLEMVARWVTVGMRQTIKDRTTREVINKTKGRIEIDMMNEDEVLCQRVMDALIKKYQHLESKPLCHLYAMFECESVQQAWFKVLPIVVEAIGSKVDPQHAKDNPVPGSCEEKEPRHESVSSQMENIVDKTHKMDVDTEIPQIDTATSSPIYQHVVNNDEIAVWDSQGPDPSHELRDPHPPRHYCYLHGQRVPYNPDISQQFNATLTSSTNSQSVDNSNPSSQSEPDDHGIPDEPHTEMTHSNDQEQDDVDQVEKSYRHKPVVVSAIPEEEASEGSPRDGTYEDEYDDVPPAWDDDNWDYYPRVPTNGRQCIGAILKLPNFDTFPSSSFITAVENRPQNDDNIIILDPSPSPPQVNVIASGSSQRTSEDNDTSLISKLESISYDPPNTTIPTPISPIIIPDDDPITLDITDTQSNTNRVEGFGRWTQDEQDALDEGLQRYGRQWVKIKEQYPVSHNRTNIQIRDKAKSIARMRRRKRIPLHHYNGCG